MENSDALRPSPGHLAPPRHIVTHDEERVEHIISDEMLAQLIRGGRDMSLQIAMGALGIAFGYAQNMVAAINAIDDSKPIGGWDGLGAAIFLLALAVFVYACFSHRNSHMSINGLVQNIRNRKRGLIVAPDRPFEAGAPFLGDPTIPKDVSATTD